MRLPGFLARSVRRKVTALVMATTLAALLVAAAALLLYTVEDYERQHVAELTAQAEIVARASAPALAFNDHKDALLNLAMLRARPDVERAALYGGNGALFAAYPERKEAVLSPDGGSAGAFVTQRHVTVVTPVVEGGQRLGRVVIEARYELRERLLAYLGILSAVMLAALAAALAVSAWLQRAVTDPILRVARAAREVVQRRDYSVRAAKTSDDEIGALADAINRMLAELEREIHERRSAEEALRNTDRRKDEFLATLAHELRNPLAPLQNGLALLRLAESDARVPAGETRVIMERQLRQMVRLVDDLLDVSRITTGKLALRRERVELRAIGAAAVEAVEPLMRQRGHRLEVALPPQGVTANADPTRLTQVFINLLNNAAKFTDPGGRVEFSLEARGGEVTARVRDSGVGIATDMIEPIFEMFAQADLSLERRASGLGVGLSLSRRLVELHGGTIEARSEGLGRGAEFVVRLPKLGVEATAPQAGGSGEPPAAAKRRVLVVDDNADFAETLARMLRAMGHEVRVEHDGLAGLRAAGEFGPEVAFLDIGMPGLNGYELARRLRELPATAASILIAITGWGQDADRQRARQAGFDRHVVKPVEMERIRELLGSAG